MKLKIKEITSIVLCLIQLAACSNNKEEIKGSEIQTVPVPGVIINCSASNSACSSQLQDGSQYKTIVMFTNSSDCSSTQSNTTIAAKGSVNTIYSTSGLSTFGEQFSWDNDVKTIAHGTYAVWSWVDLNNNNQLDIQEPSECQTTVVQGASIGTKTFGNYKSSTQADPALRY